jgi:hypothetical protein
MLSAFLNSETGNRLGLAGRKLANALTTGLQGAVEKPPDVRNWSMERSSTVERRSGRCGITGAPNSAAFAPATANRAGARSGSLHRERCSLDGLPRRDRRVGAR